DQLSWEAGVDSRAVAGGAVPGRARPVLGPQPLGHERLDRHPARLVGGVAEERRGPRIPEHDPPAFDVRDDRRVADLLEEPANAQVQRAHGGQGLTLVFARGAAAGVWYGAHSCWLLTVNGAACQAGGVIPGRAAACAGAGRRGRIQGVWRGRSAPAGGPIVAARPPVVLRIV